MPVAEEPLVEEPLQVLPDDVLEGDAQFVHLDGRVGVVLEVALHARAEGLVAEVAAQHVQHEAPLVVRVRVEHVLVRVPLVPDQRVEAPAHARAEVAAQFVHPVVLRRHRALVVLEPQVLRVVREALVERQVAPRLAGHQVAEPVVEQLVRDDEVVVVLREFARVLLHELPEDHRGRVLHRARHVVAHGHLRVLRPGVAYTGQLREEGQHLRRVREDLLGDLGVLGLHVVAQRHALPLAGPRRELPDRQHVQVGRVRLVHAPVVRAGTVAVARRGGQHAVAQRRVLIVHRHVEVLRRALVGLVDGRHPIRVVFGLALRPDLTRLLGVLVARVDEEEPLVARDRRRAALGARRGHVVEVQLELLTARVGPRQRHRDGAPVVAVAEVLPRGTAELDGRELEAFRVERYRVLRTEGRRHPQRRLPQHALAGPVEAQPQRRVQQVVRAGLGGAVHGHRHRRRVFRLGVGLRGHHQGIELAQFRLGARQGRLRGLLGALACGHEGEQQAGGGEAIRHGVPSAGEMMAADAKTQRAKLAARLLRAGRELERAEEDEIARIAQVGLRQRQRHVGQHPAIERLHRRVDG